MNKNFELHVRERKDHYLLNEYEDYSSYDDTRFFANLSLNEFNTRVVGDKIILNHKKDRWTFSVDLSRDYICVWYSPFPKDYFTNWISKNKYDRTSRVNRYLFVSNVTRTCRELRERYYRNLL